MKWPGFLREDRGSIVVLVALLLTVLLGGAGLAVDGGRGYLVRRTMQGAADAASTAGTYEMEKNWNGSGFGALAQSQIETVARNYASQNGWSASAGTISFRYMQKDGTTSASFNVDSRGVSATLSAPFPSTFGRVFGIQQYTAGAGSAAIFGSAMQSLDAIPLAINDDAFSGYNRAAGLQPAGGGGNYGQFNFVSIVPPGCAANDLACYLAAMRNGTTQPVVIPGTYPVNSFDTSRLSDATASALQARIDSAPAETCTSFATGSRRVVVIPVVGGDIGGSSVRLIRFRAFFITNIAAPNGFGGCFVQLTSGGGVLDPNGSGAGYGGVTAMALVKQP
jgi:hypothetical protein